MTVCCAHVTDLKWRKINNLLLKELLKNRVVYLHKAQLSIYIRKKKYFEKILFDLNRRPKKNWSDRIDSMFWTIHHGCPSMCLEYPQNCIVGLCLWKVLAAKFMWILMSCGYRLFRPMHGAMVGFVRGRNLSSLAKQGKTVCLLDYGAANNKP